jgi:hypothetical protein
MDHGGMLTWGYLKRLAMHYTISCHGFKFLQTMDSLTDAMLAMTAHIHERVICDEMFHACIDGLHIYCMWLAKRL